MKKAILTTLVVFCMAGFAAAQKPTYMTTAEFKTKVFNYDVTGAWKYQGDKPCVIDFYTTWCGPCKKLSPILESLATEYAGKIYFYKIDIDKERELASAFGITSIPTLVFCPMQGQPQMTQGLLPKETLQKAITDILLK